MGHKIDLSNYKIRTDLAIEAIDNQQGFKSESTNLDDVKITRITIDEDSGNRIDKKAGNYITIEFNDITDYDGKDRDSNILSKLTEKDIKNLLAIDNEEEE